MPEAIAKRNAALDAQIETLTRALRAIGRHRSAGSTIDARNDLRAANADVLHATANCRELRTISRRAYAEPSTGAE
jgi:hypothetical protein